MSEQRLERKSVPEPESNAVHARRAPRHVPTAVALLLVGAVFGAAGFLSGRLGFFTADAPPLADLPGDPATERTRDWLAATAVLPNDDSFDRRLVDPESPLPDDADALVAEWNGVVDLLVETYPETPDAWEVKARALEWLGRTEEAVACWRKCLELEPRYAYAYYGMGVVAARKEEHGEAVALLGKAMELDPSFFLTRATLADVLLKLNRPKEAVEVLEPFLARDRRSHGFFLLGRAYDQFEEHARAKESYEAAIAIYPEYAEAHHALGRVQMRLGERDQAAEAMERFRKLRTSEQARRAALRTPYHDFAAMRDRAAETYAHAGGLFAVGGRPREADRLWLRGAALGTQNAACRQALAAQALREGRVRRTIELMEELAAIEPKNPDYWLEAGRLRSGLFEIDAAEAALRRACEAAPDRPHGYAALARLYLDARRDPLRAIECAAQAAERDPSAAAQVLLAQAHDAAGDRAAALAALARAVELEPDSAEIRRRYESLQKQGPQPSPPEP